MNTGLDSVLEGVILLNWKRFIQFTTETHTSGTIVYNYYNNYATPIMQPNLALTFHMIILKVVKMMIGVVGQLYLSYHCHVTI